ncbi:MAG: hypothetical protein UY15_C0008G0007 [Parcubacteria group bacterium GW2011_GWA2_47_9]|nr:MAG: hypothetical protein UY15_C0008G0007 [Parcubacteria group bacterium GW2011_GWA2_47_9]
MNIKLKQIIIAVVIVMGIAAIAGGYFFPINQNKSEEGDKGGGGELDAFAALSASSRRRRCAQPARSSISTSSARFALRASSPFSPGRPSDKRGMVRLTGLLT